MAVTNTWEKVSINDLLKADPFGQEVLVRYPNESKPQRVMNKEIFFNKIYVDVINNEFKVMDGARNNKRSVNISLWMKEELNKTDNSLVIFIEGYAGCGKTIFVQYLLKEQLNTLYYDYSYYNYDIGAYYENRDSHRIVDAIRENFLKQIANIILSGELRVVDCFKKLLSEDEIEYIDSSKKIFYDFSNTKAFSDAVDNLTKYHEKPYFRAALQEQIKEFCCEQILAIDYLFRIAKYIVANGNDTAMLYVCYDNMDAIENFEELRNFDNTLISIRRNIDTYINHTFQNYNDIPIPRFIILATYRKITAARVELTTHSERCDDYGEDNRFIQYIDASHLYDYRVLVEKRHNYFKSYIRKKNIQVPTLQKRLDMTKKLIKMYFVDQKYSGLWNNNYRTCSDILKEIFNNYESEIKDCIELADKKIDGYNSVYSSSSGASAIFLNLICRVFKKNGLWGEQHMNLIPLGEKKDNMKISQLTSFSRIILTYISNAKDEQGQIRPVSVKEIFNEFEYLYSENEICDCLSNMLTRDKTGTWRRPIYYHRNAITDNQDIKDVLIEQWKVYKNESESKYKYTEFLLCECGQAYIDRIAMEFEFFSVRSHKDEKKSLYLIDDIEILEKTIDEVIKNIQICCRNMKIYSEQYMKKKNIKSMFQYINLPIHPRTNSGKPQLHTERIIFSHIDYLSKCRDYHISISKALEKKE